MDSVPGAVLFGSFPLSIDASDRENFPLQEQTLEHGFYLYPTLFGVISVGELSTEEGGSKDSHAFRP